MEKLMGLINKLNENFLTNKFDQGFFLTPSGKVFHENFISLVKFTFFGILSVESIPIGLTFLEMFKGKFKVGDISNKILLKIVKETPLTNEESEQIKEMFLNNVDNEDIVQIAEKFTKENPFYNSDFRAKERLYSHYIISLYAYYDSYVSSLFKFIEGKLSDFDYVDVRKINSFDDPKVKLNKLKNHFKLIEKDRLDELLEQKTWETSIVKLKEVRDKLAHRDPDAKVIDIKEEFKESHKKALVYTKDFYNHKEFDKYNILSKLLKDFKPILDLVNLLMEIGKDCYGFLVIYDQLVFNKFIE